MDPGRVKAYLQVACTGLGFDIGEIWWATDNNGSSSSLLGMDAESNNGDGGSNGKSLKFVQLYTSKSYENRRQMLVRPAEEEDENETALVAANGPQRRRRNESEKHVLSPLLVDAISKTAQVVWAHTKKQEGLIGRSDVRLQTAVGMPVAVDGNGNMCVVVMFSPNIIQSSDDALEYLQSISKGATSSSIPALLPAFDSKQGLISLPHHNNNNQIIPLLSDPAMSNGVTTRFVSLDEKASEVLSMPEVHSSRDLSSAPKDCFGIPMLPNGSEIDNNSANVKESAVSDVFDEASYGVWSTIMDTPENQVRTNADFGNGPTSFEEDTEPVYTINKPDMPAARKERLEEFAAAFLEVSVFDIAEVWIPVGDDSDYLGQVTSVTSTDSNPILNQFVELTEKIMVKTWSGAVGRAFATGNPVWNTNQSTFADAGRKRYFNQVRLETALAVPVFQGKATTPSFVFSCYAFVKSETVPFVLKFVQQALGLLWKGLDQIQPHAAIEDRLWKDVEPADLGEMAADIEMHQHFLQKKRPYEEANQSSSNNATVQGRMRMDSMDSIGGVSVNTIYTGQGPASPSMEPIEVSYQNQAQEPPPIQFTSFQVNMPSQMGDNQHNFQNIFPGERLAKRPRPMSAHEIQIQPLATSPRLGNTTVSPLMSPMPLPSPAIVLISARNGPRPMQQPQQQQQQQPQQQRHPQHQNYQHQPYPGMSSVPEPLQQQQPQQFQFSNPNQSTVSITQLPDQTSDLAQNFAAASYQQQSPQFNPTPLPAQNNTMPSVPTNQISATGISFAVPPKTASKGITLPNGLPPGANIAGMAFCMPVGPPAAAAPASSGKPCRIKGCSDPAVPRKPYCARHVGNRMCEHSGCGKCAQGATRFCIAHGGGRRCKHPGCDKGARDKNFCAAHGGGKRCKFDGCNKSAVGGSSLCTAHGGGRRCSVAGCNKSAQSSTRFCVKHGGGKKCVFAGCQKVARGRTEFCAAHGGGVRCKLEGCTRVAIGKSQLCRAHGGGNHSRGKKGSRSESPMEEMDDEDMQFSGL